MGSRAYLGTGSTLTDLLKSPQGRFDDLAKGWLSLDAASCDRSAVFDSTEYVQHLIRNFFQPAKDHPCAIWAHSVYWPSRSVYEAFYDVVDRKVPTGQSIKSNKALLHPSPGVRIPKRESLEIEPRTLFGKISKFVVRSFESTQSARQGGRWFDSELSFEPRRPNSPYVYIGTSTQTHVVPVADSDADDWCPGDRPERFSGDKVIDLFTFPAKLESDGKLLLLPRKSNNRDSAPFVICDLSSIAARRYLPFALTERIRGYHEDRLDFLTEPRTGKIVSVSLSRRSHCFSAPNQQGLGKLEADWVFSQCPQAEELLA